MCSLSMELVFTKLSMHIYTITKCLHILFILCYVTSIIQKTYWYVWVLLHMCTFLEKNEKRFRKVTLCLAILLWKESFQMFTNHRKPIFGILFQFLLAFLDVVKDSVYKSKNWNQKTKKFERFVYGGFVPNEISKIFFTLEFCFTKLQFPNPFALYFPTIVLFLFVPDKYMSGYILHDNKWIGPLSYQNLIFNFMLIVQLYFASEEILEQLFYPTIFFSIIFPFLEINEIPEQFYVIVQRENELFEIYLKWKVHKNIFFVIGQQLDIIFEDKYLIFLVQDFLKNEMYETHTLRNLVKERKKFVGECNSILYIL